MRKKNVTKKGLLLLLVFTMIFSSIPVTAFSGEDGGADAATHVHATITSLMDSCMSGATAMFTVDYKIDPNSVSEGDYLTVSIPQDMYHAGARLSVNAQHFSDVADNGDGTYRLVFGSQASTALAGSFTMMVTTDETGSKTVTVGNDSKTITVNARGESAESAGVQGGPLGYRVNKDVYSNDNVGWVGYNEDGQVAAYDSSEDRILKYRLYLNGNQERVTNAVVTDTLPDGETYVNADQIVLKYVAYEADFGPVDKDDYTIDISGQTMTITFHNSFSDAVEIQYDVLAKGGKGVRYKNDMTYFYEKTDAPGTVYQDSTSNTLVGSGNSAANGTKSVDKTEITEDGDPFVRYTIRFWTADAGGFDVGKISLTDDLNPYLKFMYADPSDDFTIENETKTDDEGRSYDSVRITNKAVIERYRTVTASFVVDMSDVPVGAVIQNTTGGNVVETTKTGGLLKGRKNTVGLELVSGAYQFLAEQVTDRSASAVVGNGMTQTVANDEDGNILFDNLSFETEGNYYFKISEIPGTDEGIQYDDTYYVAEIQVEEYIQTAVRESDGQTVTSKTLIPVGVTYYNARGERLDSEADVIFTNAAKTSVSVQKIWADNEDEQATRPTEITVNLLADGEKVDSKIVTEADDWAYEFTDLPKYENGREITYTVTEDAVSGYTTEITGDSKTGFVITNTHTPGKTSLSVSKVWNDSDNPDGVRPGSVEVQLLADGKPATVDDAIITLNETNQWQYTWSGLDEKASGKTIAYTVSETEVEGYTTEITGNAQSGFQITNTKTGDRERFTPVELTVRKTDDQDATLSGAEFTLTAEDGSEDIYTTGEDGTVTLTFTKPGNWRLRETKAPTGYKLEEVSYQITVKQSGVVSVEYDKGSGLWNKLYNLFFDPSFANNMLTVTNQQELTAVSGTKIWNDADDQDGIRPTEITVNLLADGEKVDSKIVTEADDWAYEFTDLPKYENGREITYTVTEDAVSGYTTEIAGDSKTGFRITNTHETETTAVSGTKIWNDADDQDGIRPTEITVNLLADGEKVDRKTATEADDWAYEFTGLPKYANGREITYTVAEDAVSGYTTEITGDSKTGFVITNTHTPNKNSLRVSKVWNDNDNLDGVRPGSVEVQLLADGKPATVDDAIITLNETNQWQYTWSGLDEKASGKTIAYTVSETEVEGYTTEITGDAQTGFQITNTKTGDRERFTPVELTIRKTDGTDTTLSSAEFTLTAEDGSKTVYTTGEDGTVVLTFTEPGNWRLKETKAPTGYKLEEVSYQITVKQSGVVSVEYDKGSGLWNKLYNLFFDPAFENNTLTVTNQQELTAVSGTKIWNDADDQDGIRPTEITVNLLANGKKADSKMATEADDWAYEFTDLPKYANGQEITYTVTEDAVSGYTTEIEGNAETGFRITNTHETETTAVSGTKIWNDADDQDGIRPTEITVNLLADGEKVASKTVTEADDWAYEFTGLPKYENGREITYTVTEDAVRGYMTEITGDAETGFRITNTHETETTAISGTKIWNDADDQDGIRPTEITVNLLADGEKVDSKIVTEADDWAYEFTDLPKYANGQEITYTVTEDAVSGYTTEIEGNAETGFRITNTHETETTAVSGTKIWNDADDQDGIRPTEITVNLLADGEKVDSKIVTEADDWAYEFTDLPKYENGREITYTVTEDAVSGYTTEITGDAKTGFVITNTHTPGKTSLSVSKVWNDGNDTDKVRPDSVSVQLLADNTVSGSPVVLNASNNWMYTWNSLDTHKNGKPVTYTVKEVNVPESYTQTVSGNTRQGFVITNTHEVRKPVIEKSYTAEKTSDTAGKTVGAGDRITYTITVKNTGNQTLTGIWVRDYIPQYTHFISADRDGKLGAINGKQHVDWFISELEAGKSTDVNMVVEVDICLVSGATIHNTAYTQNTENPEQPPLNLEENPVDKTNEVVDKYENSNNAGKGSTLSDIPETGDTFRVRISLTAMILSMSVIVTVIRRRKRG